MTAHARWALTSFIYVGVTFLIGLKATLIGADIRVTTGAVVLAFAVSCWRGWRTGAWKPKAETLGRWTVDESGKVRRVK